MEEWLRFSVCYWHTFRGTGWFYSEIKMPLETNEKKNPFAKAKKEIS